VVALVHARLDGPVAGIVELLALLGRVGILLDVELLGPFRRIRAVEIEGVAEIDEGTADGRIGREDAEIGKLSRKGTGRRACRSGEPLLVSAVRDEAAERYSASPTAAPMAKVEAKIVRGSFNFRFT
jgi:hypothetical protein